MSSEKVLPQGTEVMDVKKVLKNAVSEKRVIRRTDRMTLEVIKATKFYTVGQIIHPHPVLGEELIAKKVAKEL